MVAMKPMNVFALIDEESRFPEVKNVSFISEDVCIFRKPSRQEQKWAKIKFWG